MGGGLRLLTTVVWEVLGGGAFEVPEIGKVRARAESGGTIGGTKAGPACILSTGISMTG